MKNFLIRLAAVLALLFYSGNVLFAGDYVQSLLAGQRTLDMYLERASVQRSQERFEDLMEQGLGASLCEWEQNALDLKAQGLEDWLFQRELAKENLEGRAQGIFDQWLMERKKSEVQEIQKSALYSELKKLAEEFFYLDEDGKETRIVSNGQIAEAKAQWQKQAQDTVQKYLAAASSERAAFESSLVESQALNELTNALLYDHNSLKKMSDSQAALFIADKLASQIESESERSMEQLFNSLQSQVDFSGSNDVKAKKEAEENWLLRFEKELDLGLKKWNDAEEEFLSARSEWEREAENIYLNDNKKWQEAYDELQNRKIAWSQKIEAQIQEGKLEWRNKLDVLENEIDQCLLEFQSSLLWESEQKRQIVQSQEEAYAQSRAILESAQNGVEIWYQRWGEKYRGLYSYWKTEDNDFGKKIDISLAGTSYLRNEILSWKDSFASSLKDCYLKICQKKYDEMLAQKKAAEENGASQQSSFQSSQGGQEETFLDLYPQLTCSRNSSADQIFEAAQMVLIEKNNAGELADAYWECLKGARDLWSASSELFEWLDLFDAFEKRADQSLRSLYSDSCANIQIVDELSSEKAKASWLVDYWTSRVQIAQAVSDYAQNNFSDLEWAERTENNLDEALEGYKRAKEEYQEAFDLAQEKRLCVLAERDKYYEALDAAQALLEKIESEQEAYDKIYQAKLELVRDMEKDPAMELFFDLQSLAFQGEDFKKYLWRYCSEDQEAFDMALEVKVEILRDVVENGYENIDESLADAAAGENFSKFSIAQLQAMEEELSQKGDFEALALVKKESQNRRALLLLLDGTLDEIHAFFDGNEDFIDIYQNYKDYSAAILKKEAASALEALKEVVSQGKKSGLESYFSDLDQAAQGASAFVLGALGVYKDLLLCQKDCLGLEKSLGKKLSECQSLTGRIPYSPVDWFCDECEEFFLCKDDFEDAAGYDRSDFERLSFGRKELLEKIEGRLDFLAQSSKDLEAIELSLEKEAAALRTVQKEWQKSLDAISASAKDSLLNRYINACAVYNENLELCQESFDKLEAARRNYRLAQEIYFYGQNEYLHNSYDPDENLKAAKDSLQKASAALDALNSIKQEKIGLVLDGYKAECANYFKCRVMLFEYEQRLASQTESLYKAQAAERAAEEKLVSECVPQGYEAELSPFARDLICASVDQDGIYSFSLNKNMEPLSQENQELLIQYYSDYRLVQTDIYQNEYRSTQAKKDALDFLEALQTKNYGLLDLAFCALYLKGLGDDGQKLSWYKSGENPAADENFKIGDLPGSIHGIDVSGSYHSERLKLLQETYKRVISLNGEDDIVKFILHCDATFSKQLDLDKICRNGLISASLEKPIDLVESSGESWNRDATAFFAMAAMYCLIACLPFGIGSWAAGIAASCMATGMAFQSVANQLRSYASDMKSVRNGCKENLEEALGSIQKAALNWQKAKERREEESQKLSLLISGKSQLDEKKMTWNDFSRALQETFDPGSLGVDSSYFMSVCDSSLNQDDLRDFFEELASKEDFYDARSAIEKMSARLNENYAGKKEALDQAFSDRKDSLDFDIASYYEDLLSFYSKDLLQNMPVAMNRRHEDYMTEAFGLYNSLADEALEYSAKNRFSQKKDLCSFVYADMDEQRSLWEEKNQMILDTAQSDWLCAQEQINLSYNSWQKEFSLDYQRSSQKWQKNYDDFLNKKKGWLFNQYLSGGGEADASYSLVDSLKSSYVESLCDADKFSRLADLTKTLSAFSQNESCVQDFFEKMDVSLIRDYGAALSAQRDLQENLKDAAAREAAQRCQAMLENDVNNYFEMILDKNKSVEKWELEMVREAGYTVDPLIHRNAIVDVSFSAVSRERQDVHRYEYFAAAAPATDLDASAYLGSSEYFIMKKVEEAQGKIQKWAQEIFGTDASQKSGGRLAEHIGQAPVFVQNIDPTESRESNVKDFGSGQMGRILLDYQWNSIVSAAAASDFSRPIYDQKMMDINGYALPSLRDIAGVVCDIISKIPAFCAFQYLDDAVFGVLDVGFGYKTWGDVASDFAKQGLVAGAAKAAGSLSSAVGKAFGNSSGILQKAAAGYLNNVAANYAAAFDFASGKMDWDKAAASWHDARTLTSLAGSVLGQGLGFLNNLDANGLALNSMVFGDIQSMNNTIGSLAGQAFNYIATGDFSVNLINIQGVGIFEIGVSGGNFKAGIGQGGADLSAQNLLAFAKGAEAASKVSALKKSGVEGQTLLNAANLLAWSGGEQNVGLASDLFDGRRSLAFEEGASVPAFGKTIDETIVLNKALLEQGKEGQALVAAYAALQNLSQDGSPEKFSATLEAMTQISSVLAVASQALDFDLADLQEKNSLTVLADAYKQNGIAGVYALYADVKKEADSSGQESSGLAELLEQPWFQNVAENRGILLGQSMTMEEYNKAAKQNAVERYAAQKVKDFLAKNSGASADEAKLVGDEARAKAASEIVEGVANEKYGYKPETYSLDIKNYGCVLSTAAYIAYSITGKISTLAEANDILNKEDLFLYGVDSNGVGQKNLLAAGDNYASAVNAIAGGDYLKKDGENFSVSALLGGRDNRQSIFNRLLQNSRDQDEVYFTHMRVKDSHSVLFDSLSYTDEKNYKTSTLSVMDPWQGGKFSPKSWSDISRADFYKLTQTGKELYELTRESLRAGSAS